MEYISLCDTVSFFIYFTYNSVYLSIPNSWFIPPCPPFLFDYCKFVFFACEYISIL